MHLTLTATSEDQGQRIDAWLAAHAEVVTRSAAAKLLETGGVTVNGQPAAKNYRLRGDETVEVVRPEAEETSVTAQDIPLDVVYEDADVIVVNKPAGLAVDGPEDDTLLNRALLYLNQQGEYKENDLYTPALCHRLDTGTSGLVILAKTPEAEQLFLEVIKNREVKKTYLCVTFGRPVPPDGTLGGYLLKDADRGIVKIVEDKQPGAKDVETQYETIAVSGRLALLKVRLITGRTHQIRAQFSSRGLPPLGDVRYGSRDPGCDCALWSFHLRFVHPVTGKEVEVFRRPPEAYPWNRFPDGALAPGGEPCP